MKCTGVALIILALLLLAEPAWCYKPDYGPFAPGQGIPLAELHPLATPQLPTLEQAPNSPRRYTLVDQNRHIDLGLFYDTTLGYAADLVWGTSDAEMISAFALYGHPYTLIGVYWAYLNDDEYKDFIIMNTVDGAGLAGSFGYVSFMLSSSSGYEMVQVETWEPSRAEFVVVGGQCTYIQTNFVEGLPSKDGREHNYWLYNLFSFDGVELVLANQLDSRLPKWVLYTWEENHVETSYLTATQKRKYERDVPLFGK